MSKLFSDPEYKAMAEDEESWLELAIEPFRFYLNDVIHSLPEQITLNFEDLFKYFSRNSDDSYLRMEVANIIGNMVKDAGHKLSSRETELVMKLYEVQADPNCIVNFVDKTMSSPIVIKKTAVEIPEDEVREVVADLCQHALMFNDPRTESNLHSPQLSRMNEIIDLLGFKKDEQKARSSRSIRKKEGFIKRRMSKIIIEDEWRVRSSDLLINFCKNISNYVNDGNLHAMMNITRLKCMTHKGDPIYSMEEIK